MAIKGITEETTCLDSILVERHNLLSKNLQDVRLRAHVSRGWFTKQYCLGNSMLNRPWAGWAANAVQTGNHAPKDGAKNRGAAQSAKEELRFSFFRGGSASIFLAQVSKQVIFEPCSQLQCSTGGIPH